MSDNLTPPAAPAPAEAPVPRQISRRSKLIASAFLVGGILIASTAVASAVTNSVRLNGDTELTLTAATTGVTQIDIDNAAASIRIEFGNVSEATVVASTTKQAGVSNWRMRTDGTTLSVDQNNGWLNFVSFWGVDGGSENVTLTLPATLEGKVGLDLQTNAGAATIVGDYRTADLGLSAGAVDFTGSTPELSIAASAGRVTFTAADVQQLDVRMSAGTINGTVTGKAPRDSSFNVSAGDITVTLPAGPYNVSQDSAAGSISVGVDTSSTAQNLIDVQVSAGSVKLKQAP